MSKKYMLVLIALLIAAFLVVACGTGEPTVPPAGGETQAPAGGSEQPAAPSTDLKVPFTESFVASGHADAKAEAFNHWNEEDPKEVPTGCAKCHTSAGFKEFAEKGKNETSRIVAMSFCEPRSW